MRQASRIAANTTTSTAVSGRRHLPTPSGDERKQKIPGAAPQQRKIYCIVMPYLGEQRVVYLLIVLTLISAVDGHFVATCVGCHLQHGMMSFSSSSGRSRPLFSFGSSSMGDYDCDPVPINTPARQSLPDHLVLKPIPGKGLGVVTRVHIPCNTVIGDYIGEVITGEVKDRRYLATQQHLREADDLQWAASRTNRGQTITGDYLYGVTMPGGSDPVYIDAEDEYESLWTRFLNHASPPGNNVNPKSIHQSFDGKPRVWFVSNRDIGIGEELCFNYGDDYWLPGDEVF